MQVQIDKVGRPKIDSDSLFEIIYTGNKNPLPVVDSPAISQFKTMSIKFDLDWPYTVVSEEVSDSDYVAQCVKNWAMPKEYYAIDLEQYFAERISSIVEAERVQLELELYRERQLETVLKFIIYLVDVMKTNKIVWGVGRGSSVASYCLYLIGLHKIDSIKYELDIKEFLK
jgi:DNA polymerase III alpha subunit